MKYIKIASFAVFGTDNLTKEDLVRLKDHQYDAIINRITEEYYDVETNEWKSIQNIDEEQPEATQEEEDG